jgi:S1-C subfamily serine protease
MVLTAPLAAAATLKGTGFAVSDDGMLVTNEHVVLGCRLVSVRLGTRQLSGTVVATDRVSDLALVQLRERTPAFATLRRGPAIRIGEQVVTYGFPLSGSLATEGNLTVGYISALRGLRDDDKTIQITAPVQPGNSGGPLMDQSGHVVGVVAAKLDAMKVMRIMGDVPQNVNFAITLDRLKRFLQANNVRLADEPSAEELRPVDIGDRVRTFTYLIECQPPAVAQPQPAARPRTVPAQSVGGKPIQVQAQAQAQAQPPATPAGVTPPVPAPPSAAAANPAPGPNAQAAAVCLKEFAAAKQLLQETRGGVVASASAAPAARCQALQRHYTAMAAARDLFARCDTGDQRVQHAAQLDASMAQFKKSMPADCTQ